MSPANDSKLSTIQHKLTIFPNTLLGTLFKSLIISGFVLYFLYIALFNHSLCQSSEPVHKLASNSYRTTDDSATSITHLVFGIAGFTNAWRNRKPYVESWWRPNITRGFIFLDRAPTEHLPWSSSSPPFRVSEDTSRYKDYDKHGALGAVRMARVVLETFREEREGARWFVMADDDTIFFLDNLVEILARYDHTKYLYIGANSESVRSNFDFSFDMAFGGAGYALSYPLAEALANNIDVCIKNYPTLYGSDHIMQSCVSDLGVTLTQEKGFHQIDLRGDISGFLSAHPQSPLVSLHHLDMVEPIFPGASRYESINHLMEAAKPDQSRLLQQSICYHKDKNWSLTISWGYSVHIYENIYPPSFLERPLETFTPWKRIAPGADSYRFNTRRLFPNDPCQAPHVFYFKSVEETSDHKHIVTSYNRRWPRRLPACPLSGNHSADFISDIRVFSPSGTKVGSRRECCDIVQVGDKNLAEIKIRTCMRNEIVGSLIN